MEKDVAITNSSGRKLHGVIAVPDSTHMPLVIICHGYASSTKSNTRVELARRLSQLNISSLGFDFTGCGESEGELHELTITQGLADLTAAFNSVKTIDRVDKNKIALLGSSFSGSVAVLFAAENNIKALGLKSPVSDYSQLSGVPLAAKRRQQNFFDDAAKYDVCKAAEKIKVPAIIVHGSEDADVPVMQSKKLFSRLKCEKNFEMIEGADHRYSNSRHFSQMIELFAGWFDYYLS
ncbi:alpha/beta hydrolase [Candidatus Woesearchaeota archaeon]|nr:alpha/beta hydrolase [Candidatus Woesearchaeota archaeon]